MTKIYTHTCTRCRRAFTTEDITQWTCNWRCRHDLRKGREVDPDDNFFTREEISHWNGKIAETVERIRRKKGTR